MSTQQPWDSDSSAPLSMDDEALRDHFSRPPALYPLFHAMHQLEGWVCDPSHTRPIPSILRQIEKAVQACLNGRAAILSEQDCREIFTSLGYISTPRSIRLLQAMICGEIIESDMLCEFVDANADSPAIGVVERRLQVIDAHGFFDEVFRPFIHEEDYLAD